MKAATLDYSNTALDEDGRQKVAPVGGWHTAIVMGHSLVREDTSVLLVLAIESAEVCVAVGPQSDARLHELFDGLCATVVRTALEPEQEQEQEQEQLGHRPVIYTLMANLGPDTVLLVEDHTLYEDGADRGELMLCFSPVLNPHLLGVFTPPVAEAIRTALRAA
ncbi:hypothetical protein [Streptomyces sp. NPDC001948]